MHPWNLIHPRFAFWLGAGKPLRSIGILFSVLFFLILAALTLFGAVGLFGRIGIGPLVEWAAREREFSSVVLGFAVTGIFALLMAFSLRKQFRNLFADLPAIEGRIESLSEEYDSTDGGLGNYLSVRIQGKEYILKYRLRKILKAGMRVRIVLWAGTEDVRAVWVAW